MSEIAANLHVGGWHDARDRRAEFDVIINCAVDAPHNGDYQFGLVDGPGNAADVFAAAVEEVYQHFSSGKRVLVHCVAGMSRSVTVTAAALHRMGVPDALEFVKVKRGCDAERPKCPHPAMVEMYSAYIGGTGKP